MRTVGGCTLDWLTSGTEIETDAKRKKEERTPMSKAPVTSECMSKAKSDGAVRLCEAWCEGVRRMGTRDDSTDRCALLFKGGPLRSLRNPRRQDIKIIHVLSCEV